MATYRQRDPSGAVRAGHYYVGPAKLRFGHNRRPLPPPNTRTWISVNAPGPCFAALGMAILDETTHLSAYQGVARLHMAPDDESWTVALYDLAD